MRGKKIQEVTVSGMKRVREEQRVKAEEKNVSNLVKVYVKEESKIIYIMLSLGHCGVFSAFILNGLAGHW